MKQIFFKKKKFKEFKLKFYSLFNERLNALYNILFKDTSSSLDPPARRLCPVPLQGVSKFKFFDEKHSHV